MATANGNGRKQQLWSGTRALVTGASAGLGEEFARQLAARGAALILSARRTERLEALAGELRGAHGVDVAVVPGDLAAPGGPGRLCDEIERRGLAVDHLICNAGFGAGGSFLDGDVERQAEMVRLNCEAVVVLTRRFLPAMVARGAGGVLHVASLAGMQPVPWMATYGATKAFVLSFAQAIAEEVRGSGVRVSALCPGPVPTEFQKVAGMEVAPSQRSAVLSAAETVKRGLAAYERGTVVYVPGAMNQLSSFGSRLMPRGLVVRTVGKMMKAKRPA